MLTSGSIEGRPHGGHEVARSGMDTADGVTDLGKVWRPTVSTDRIKTTGVTVRGPVRAASGSRGAPLVTDG
jgi:hypothetical protein